MRIYKTTAGLLAMTSFLFYSSFLAAYNPDNPANDQLFIEYSTATDSQIELLNAFGKVIFSRSLKSGTGNLIINSSNFSSGLYLMQLYDAEGKASTQKIIITH